MRVPAVMMCSVLLCGAGRVRAVAPADDGVVYELTDETTYHVGCIPPCRCPIRVADGVHGTFRLTPAASDPLFQVFNVTDVAWTITLGDTELSVTGSGTYRVGGEVAVVHQLALDLKVGDAPIAHFDSGRISGGQDFPAIDALISVYGMGGCYDEWFEVRARPRSEYPPRLHYELREGSWLIDDCPACARPILVRPLTGTFSLILRLRSLQTDVYDVATISLQTKDGKFHVSGSGSLRIGVGPANVQVMDLTLEINGETGIPLHGEAAPPSIQFPELDIALDEDTDSIVRVYRLRLNAAPRPLVDIPLLADWGLPAMSLWFGLAGTVLLRRRRGAPSPAD